MKHLRWVPLLCLLGACTPEPPPQATCEAFVGAWDFYELRCGSPLWPSRDLSESTAEYFFGTTCEQTTIDDFRDARALREDCPDALAEWPCTQPSLPAPCTDQIQ